MVPGVQKWATLSAWVYRTLPAPGLRGYLKGYYMATKQKPAKPAALPAPVAATPAVVAKVVALRGGQAIATVKLAAKAYRTGCTHNAAWWATIGQQVAAGNGTAPVATLLAAKVPAPFVGYCVRRGYLVAA